MFTKVNKMKINKNVTVAILLSAFALTGCSSISVSEKSANKVINQSVEKTWRGTVQNTFDHAVNPYQISVESLKIDFKNTESYYDSEIEVLGTFHIDNKPYQANSDIKILLSANTFINKEDSSLEIREPYVKKIDLPNLYNAYSADIMKSLQDSLDKTSGLYLKGHDILNFSKEVKELEKTGTNFELIKKSDGKKLYVEYLTR